MSKILHVVNSFDPSADVVRCVRELKKHSKHEHEIYVQEFHPGTVYQFEQAPGVGDPGLRERLLQWADAILYQFVGHDSFPDAPNKPAAFRNINIYWDKESDKFWSHPKYNATTFDRYSEVASSHAGAADFLTEKPFTWLPDLLPQDGLYTPKLWYKDPCVSFIKHADYLRTKIFPGAIQNLSGMPHREVLRNRSLYATVVIDNVIDGHWGLAGHEALLMALPVIVFNHKKTKDALAELTGRSINPFIEVGPSIEEAEEVAKRYMKDKMSSRYMGSVGRQWAEYFMRSEFLIRKKWDPFFDRLVKA